MDPFVTTLGIRTGIAGWKLLQTKAAKDFPVLTKDPVVQREIAYFRQNAFKALTPEKLLADRRLQDFALTAFGMSSQIGMTGLVKRVLASDPDDKTSFAAQMTDQRFVQLSRAFSYGVTPEPSTPATPSSAAVSVTSFYSGSNLAGFSGAFGGVTVPWVDLTSVGTWSGLASALQAGFRRADGNRSDITVTLDGTDLKFTDAKGRGGPAGFAWVPNSANNAGTPVVSDPFNVAAGTPAGPVTGGPAVTKPAFVEQVVQRYLEAQFEVVLGNSSNTLRQARYAQRQLPNVTNWYSVIADRPLANVIQTVLGLPTSFAMLNVDQQASALSKKMKLEDFKDPAKLEKMLTRFITMAEMNTNTQSTAVTLLDTYRSTGIVNLNLSSGSSDSFSSSSSAALVMSTAWR